MNNEPMTFGEVLGKLLDEANMTRVMYAAELKKTPVAVHKLVNDSNSPSINRALELLDRFDRTIIVVKREDELPESAIPLRNTKGEEKEDEQ